jgi:hypothetical protein
MMCQFQTTLSNSTGSNMGRRQNQTSDNRAQETDSQIASIGGPLPGLQNVIQWRTKIRSIRSNVATRFESIARHGFAHYRRLLSKLLRWSNRRRKAKTGGEWSCSCLTHVWYPSYRRNHVSSKHRLIFVLIL